MNKEKIKEFLKKNWLICIATIIILFLAISSIVDKSKLSDLRGTLSKVEQSIIKKEIVDSIKTKQAKQTIDSLEKTIDNRDSRITSLNSKISIVEKDNKKLQYSIDTALAHFYGKDTTYHTLPVCEGIVKDQQKLLINKDIIIGDKNQIIVKKDSTIKNVNYMYLLQIDETARSRDLYKICSDNTKLLSDKLKKQDTWWRRNEKWFYFGGGVVSTAGLVYLLKP